MRFINVNCDECEDVFTTTKYVRSKGRGRFCSIRCYSENCAKRSVGRECLICGTRFKIHASVLRKANGGKYCSAKCQHLSLKRLTGKKANAWKGEKVGYRGLHKWVEKVMGRPAKCDACSLKGVPDGRKRYFEWANKSGRYLREVDDWLRLCKSCYINYDKTLKCVNN